VVGAGVETARILSHSGGDVATVSAIAGFLAVVLPAYSLAGIAALLAVVGMVRLLVPRVPADAVLRDAWARLRAWVRPPEPAVAVTRGLTLLAFASACGAFLAMAFVTLRTLLATAHSQTAILVTHVLLLLPASALAWLAYRVLVRCAALLGERGARRWPLRLVTPLRVAAVLVSLVVAGAAGVLVRKGHFLSNVNYDPILQLALWATGLAGLTAWVALAPAGRLGRLVSARVTFWAALAVVGALLPASVVVPPHTIDARQYLGRGDLASARVVRQLRRLTDFDRDGWSALFGGSDCAPSDAAISPGALETPGNGRDEDCLGGDLAGPAAPTALAEPARPSAAVAGAQPPNVVVIASDSFRYDHTSLAGYARDTTPNLARFARSATTFSRAYTSVPYTGGAFPTIFASRSALVLQGGIAPEPYRTAVRSEFPRFHEVLKRHGYRTAGVDARIGSYVQGFGSGFDTFVEVADTRAPSVVAAARQQLDRLAAQGGPWFLFVYFYDAHHHDYLVAGMETMAPYGDTPMDEFDLRIKYWDGYFQELLAAIEERTDADRTAIIYFSDHGEAFHEHGWAGHGHTLHEEQVHVPVVLRVPGGRPAVVDSPVSLLDIAPTVLALAGADPAETRGSEGRSLLPYLHGPGVDPDRVVFTESYRLGAIFGATTRSSRAVYDYWTGVFTFYDLARDPRELSPTLVATNPAQVRLQAALAEYVSSRRLTAAATRADAPAP